MGRKQLAQVQRAVAPILMEPAEARSFARDPHAYARAKGLRASHADLLASLDAQGAAYFASRRRIDRHAYLAADLPRSARHLAEASRLEAYFDACPYAGENPRSEAENLLAWVARRRAVPAWLRDLVRLEGEAFLLLSDAAARSAALVVVAHDPDQLLGPKPGQARRGRFAVALRCDGDDVDVERLAAREHRVLRGMLDGKRPAAGDLAVVGSLVERGLVPAPAGRAGAPSPRRGKAFSR